MTDSVDHPDWGPVLQRVERLAGIDLKRDAQMRERLVGVLGGASDGCPQRAYGLLREDGSLLGAVFDALCVRESFFFREARQFRWLREQALPRLVGRLGERQPLSVWSAGCAGGEEAYSMAIVLAQEDWLERARITATDSSPGVLRVARAGVYRPWSLRQVEPWVWSWFEERADGFEIKPELRKAVTVRYMNLAGGEDAFAECGLWRMDVILCRNVLIYFTPEAAQRAVAQLAATLAPGGVLLFGTHDPVETVPGLIPAGFRAFAKPLAGESSRPPPTPVLASSSAPPAPRRVRPRAVLAPARREPAPVKPQFSAQTRATLRGALSEGRYEHILLRVPAEDADSERLVLRILAVANLRGSGAAAQEADSALQRIPTSAQLHLIRGMLHMSIDEVEQAERSLRGALYLNPKLVAAHLKLGLLLAETGRRPAALRSLRVALELSRKLVPGDAVGVLSVGDAERMSEAILMQYLLLKEEEDT